MINLAEAWLEVVVISLKDHRHRNYAELNAKEHSRSLALAILMAIPFLGIALVLNLYWLIPAIVVNRRLLFDHPLKSFRNKKIRDIEGSGPFDTLFRSIYGKQGGWFELGTELAITIISIILQFST